MQMLNTGFGDTKRETSEWFLWMSCGETVAKNCKHLDHLTTDHTVENVKVHKLWMKTKYHFGDCWWVRPLVWNIPANFRRGLYGIFFFFNLCFGWWREGMEIFDCQELFCPRDLPFLLAWLSPLHFPHVSESIVSRISMKFRNGQYHTCDFQVSSIIGRKAEITA
jgi:hypothetical protein